LILTLIGSSWPLRRFLLYFAALFLVMTILGIQPKRVTLVSPWLTLVLGVASGTLPRRFLRQMIWVSLLWPAAMGWFGIPSLSMDLYAAPRRIKPWSQVARRASEVIRNVGIVIGNNPSFFFHTTYAFPDNNLEPSQKFAGLPPNIRRSGLHY